MSNPIVTRRGRFSPNRTMVWYLFLLGFLAIFSTTISKNPVLSLFSQALGADDAVIGMIAAVSPLAGILLSFPVGVLSDNFGRRKLLITSGMVFLTAPLCYLFITDPVWLIPVRFFHGTATAILVPVISAVIAERFPDTKGAMLGQFSSATLTGRTIAPVIGGIILSYFVFYPGLTAYRIVYLVAALAAVPVLFMTFMYREERTSPHDTVPLSRFRESLVTFFSHARLRATAFVDLATYFAFGAFETFLPLLLASQGITAFQTGIIFAVQVLIIAGTKPFFGKLADHFDKRIQIAAGLVIVGCSMGAIPFVSFFALFLLVSATLGLGMSLSTVATSAYIADIAHKDQIGAFMGALSSTMDIGHSAGPLIAGIIITTLGYTAGFFSGFILAITITVVFILSVRGQA